MPAGMGILNEVHAAEIIVFVSRNPGCSKTDLYRGVARGVRMPDKLLMLRDAGILEIVDAGSPFEAELLTLLRRHRELTGSRRAAALLDTWEEARPRFVMVLPVEYRRVLARS